MSTNVRLVGTALAVHRLCWLLPLKSECTCLLSYLPPISIPPFSPLNFPPCYLFKACDYCFKRTKVSRLPLPHFYPNLSGDVKCLSGHRVGQPEKQVNLRDLYLLKNLLMASDMCIDVQLTKDGIENDAHNL